MLTTLWTILAKLLMAAPKIVADIESDVSKIKADTNLAQRIKDGFAAFDQLLTDILGTL